MNSVKYLKRPLFAGLIVGLAAMFITIGLATANTGNATAAPPAADPTPSVPLQAQACSSCHKEIAESWTNSPHAHAFDDSYFQERWHSLGDKGDCLLCHTTEYVATTGDYSAPGVSCEACHGQIDSTHPLTPAPIQSDAEYCGTCHTTTLGEWRLTGHSHADVGCTDCHDPHSQKALFEVSDDMCINCHKDSMSESLENSHAQKGIGCVDCHALVIPPEVPPVDGIVPTGHTFTITPATCVACHTDALHTGFSLPGYENGAKAAHTAVTDTEKTSAQTITNRIVQTPEEQIQTLENKLQAMEASNASRSMTVIFQGGVIGLVLGGSTAWIVSSNVRRGREEEEGQK